MIDPSLEPQQSFSEEVRKLVSTEHSSHTRKWSAYGQLLQHHPCLGVQLRTARRYV